MTALSVNEDPVLAGCASDIALLGSCTIYVKGTLKLVYMGAPVPYWDAPVEFSINVS